jgi:rhodanese-related sulfurtransferase
MGFFNNLFNTGTKVDLRELLNSGAMLLDVRTRGEYASGHAENSKNIPLDELGNYLHQFNKEQNFILVCASGMRSANAVSMMKRNGFANCYNGGSWINFR